MKTRVTNDELVCAYRHFGSVWKAAKHLGIGGQSVWERLKRLDIPMPASKWTTEELEELHTLAPSCTVGEIARRLGRSYAGVACKISELQIGVRFGNSVQKRIKRGSGMTKAATAIYLRDLNVFGGSIRQFCVQRGLDIESLVLGIQRHHLAGWDEYASKHSELQPKPCPQCKRDFIPMNPKQATCSRRCSGLRRSDLRYFGGRRNEAVGLQEGICQLCERERPRLAAHHIHGKENDTENQHLIALCAGCHGLVGSLGVRSDVLRPEFWENLIALAAQRKLGDRQVKPLGFYTCVEIEELTEEDIEDEDNEAA